MPGSIISKVYSFNVISDLKRITLSFKFGDNNLNPSSITFSEPCSIYTDSSNVDHKYTSTHTMLLDEAFPAPVDKNIQRFLSLKPGDDCISNTSFHQLVARISNRVKVGFDSLLP